MIGFHGGAGSVTGANFLLEIDGKKILIDCGLNQGTKMADDINWEPFQYAVNTIDILFVTHAHVDHLGRVPKLISEGFQGKIYSTLPTRSLALPMLEDTATILSHNREFDLTEIYSPENLKRALTLWEGFPYYQKVQITEDLSFTFYNAGHILGSAMILFNYNGKNILFTGKTKQAG